MTKKIHTIANSDVSTFYKKGATMISSAGLQLRKVKALLTEDGRILFSDTKDKFSLEEITEIYGGKNYQIIEIDIAEIVDNSYVNELSFPEIKNKEAYEKFSKKR